MRDLFTKDLGWKLFSLLLAMALWFTANRILHETSAPNSVSGGSTVTYGKLPVVVVSTASDVHLYRVVPGTVTVTVKALADTMAVLQANQIRAVVDLTGMDSDNDIKRPVEVSVPAGVTLISVQPAQVNVIVPPLPVKSP